MDTRAIDSSQIGNMETAIENYTEAVETGIKSIRDYEISEENGVYGSAQMARINNYIEETCTEINAIVRYFDKFKEVLSDISTEYSAESGKIDPGTVTEHSTEGVDDIITVNRMG